jgi:MazG family protein
VRPIERLLQVMSRLRDPETGCPWDVGQTFATIAPYTLEEAYEVADAIARNDPADLREELGDLLLQVVYHAQMAHEAGWFDFDAVAATVADKMVRRHPHVFGEERIADAAAQSDAWERHKEVERAAKADVSSILDDVPRALPALTRAQKLQRRAARVGFDWLATEPVFAKIAEETAELRQALADGEERGRVAAELGDLLFSVVNLARRLDFDAEAALRVGNASFERRFRRMEQTAERRGVALADLQLEELEELWQAAKATDDDAT